MTSKNNKNGRPKSGYHFASNEIKAVNTLYGLIMGITADQIVTDSEIMFLDLWLKDNEAYTSLFPLNVIKQRIDAILASGIITQTERESLCRELMAMQGNNFQETGMVGGFSNASIFDQPDCIIIKDSVFCLTGQFTSGPRDRCERALKKFGGILAVNITQKLDYLVVGSLSSRDWITSGHGRKIEKALHYKQKGHEITILSEEILLNFLHF